MTTSSLDSILSSVSAAAPAPEPKAETPAPVEQAPKPVEATPATEPKPEGHAKPQGDDPATPETASGGKTVPLAALHDEREKGKKRYTEVVTDFDKKFSDYQTKLDHRFEQLVAALRAPQPQPQQNVPEPPRPDFFADPDAAMRAAIQEAISPIMAQTGRMSETVSRRFAVQEHGQDTVQSAYAEIERRVSENPRAMQGEYQRIMASGDPWGELVKWHRNETALKEIGNDPAAFRERMKAELLAELQGQKPAAATPGTPAQPASANPAAPAPVMPTNLAAVRNAGSRSGPEWTGPAPLQDIFNRAQRKTAAH